MTTYHAFLSYSRKDTEVAKRLQHQLERHGRFIFTPSDVTVFRDRTNLRGYGPLAKNLEEALDRSAFLILLASPNSAKSDYVAKEVRYWLDRHGQSRDAPEGFIIALSDGTLTWPYAAPDYHWTDTTAIAKDVFEGRFHEAVTHVELFTSDEARTRVRFDPVAISTIAADIRGRDRFDQLRKQQWVRGITFGVIATVFLFILALTGVAIREFQESAEQGAAARSRSLAAAAVEAMDQRLDLASLLAVEAYRMAPTAEARAALLQVSAASPQLVRYVPLPGPVTALASTPDGGAVAVATEGGHVLIWDLTTPAPVELASAAGSYQSIAMGGGVVVAATGTAVDVWREPGGPPRRIDAGGQVLQVGVSPTGARAAAAIDSGQSTSGIQLELYDLASATVIADAPTDQPKLGRIPVAMPADDRIRVAGFEAVEEWTTDPLHRTNTVDTGMGVDPTDRAFSAGATAFVANARGTVIVDDLAGPRPVVEVKLPIGASDTLTISDDGTRVAAAAGGTIHLASVDPRFAPTVPPQWRTTRLTGNARVNRLTFLGHDGNRLVSASGAALTLWNFTQVSRIAVDTGVGIEDENPAKFDRPEVVVLSDGRRLAISNPFSNALHLVDLEQPARSVKLAEGGEPVWVSDDGSLALGPFGTIWRPYGGTGGTSVERPPVAQGEQDDGLSDILATSRSYDGQFTAVTFHGQVEVRRVPDGRRQTVVRPGDVLSHPGIAVTTDGRYAAIVNEHDITLVEVPGGAIRTIAIATATEVAFVGHRLFVVELAGALHEIDVADGHILRTVKTGTTLGPYRPWTIDDTATTLAVLTPTDALELVDLSTNTSIATLPPIDQSGDPQEAGGQTWIGFLAGRSDLVSVTAGGSVVRWLLSVNDWRRVACATAGRDLTAAEWRANTDAPVPGDLACARSSGP